MPSRQGRGEFRFGLPRRSDATWLFISLALEKLRPASEGGGRVAALVHPAALSAGGEDAAVRREILAAGLLESVTRLPQSLAPSTGIPLHLLTFTNTSCSVGRPDVTVVDLQTAFTTEHRKRSLPDTAFTELESALRTGKPGPRCRIVAARQFIRREAEVSRVTAEGVPLSWRVTTFHDTPIDGRLLAARYGTDSGVLVGAEPRTVVDLNPARLLSDDTRELIRDLDAKGWPARRLTGLLAAPPEVPTKPIEAADQTQVVVPLTPDHPASLGRPGTEANGLSVTLRLDGDALEPGFLVAWLNSEQGVWSRRRALEAARRGGLALPIKATPDSLLRWADELIVPVPSRRIQLQLATADRRLRAFRAELETQRAAIWASPDEAEAIVGRFAPAFDDSLTGWLDQLPYPIASALWTAETMPTPAERQRAHLHAWEAIVTFHATALLSATRSDPGRGREVEASIRRTLRDQHLSIERATFGTWVVIAEKAAKELRDALRCGDPDEAARIRRAFGDLGRGGIERLVSKEIIRKFGEVNHKRNRWLGHGGYTSQDEWQAQVISLRADLGELRQLLGNVWAQLVLVRAGSARRDPGGLVQRVEVAMGTRSPFRVQDFRIGDLMIDGELYLVRDGSQSPLRLGQFVQLRAAPRDAQYTSYFYNRTEGDTVRLVSYQTGPASELQDDPARFRDDFRSLVRD